MIVLIDAKNFVLQLLNGFLFYKLPLRVALPENPIELLNIPVTFLRDKFLYFFHKLLNFPFDTGFGS